MIPSLWSFAVMSIFTIPGIQLSRDPGYRSSNFSKSGVTGRSRRQSMLLWNMKLQSIQLISLEVAVARWDHGFQFQPWLWFRPPAIIFMAICEVWGAVYKKLIPYKIWRKVFQAKLYRGGGGERPCMCYHRHYIMKTVNKNKIKWFWQCATRSLSLKWWFFFHRNVMCYMLCCVKLLCIIYIRHMISLLTMFTSSQ